MAITWLARDDIGTRYFFLVLCSVFLIGLLFLARHLWKKKLENLRGIAGRFPGMSVDEGNWTKLPTLRHTGPGWRAIVSFFEGIEDSPPYTRVEFQLEKSVPVLKLSLQGFLSGISKFFGAQDIEIGVPDFDKRYMIAAQPPEFARTFLDESARRAVERIRGFADGLSIEVSGRSARVNIVKCLRDPQSICAYLESAFSLVALLASPERETGIEIVSQTAAGEGLCQVCGAAMTSDRVRCRKCRTPHHRECWVYLGGCSTFACGEKRFE